MCVCGCFDNRGVKDFLNLKSTNRYSAASVVWHNTPTLMVMISDERKNSRDTLYKLTITLITVIGLPPHSPHSPYLAPSTVFHAGWTKTCESKWLTSAFAVTCTKRATTAVTTRRNCRSDGWPWSPLKEAVTLPSQTWSVEQHDFACNRNDSGTGGGGKAGFVLKCESTEAKRRGGGRGGRARERQEFIDASGTKVKALLTFDLRTFISPFFVFVFSLFWTGLAKQ